MVVPPNPSRWMARWSAPQNNYQRFKVDKLEEALPEAEVLPDPLENLTNAMSSWKDKHIVEKLKLQPVQEQEVVKHISNMKNSGSFGHNQIDARTIKAAVKVLAKPITYLINLSIMTSTFVNKWQIGKIIPLYKGKASNQLEPSSYRPISLLPMISKLAERVVQSHVVEHFDKFKLWNNNQHGYRRTRSTTMTLLGNKWIFSSKQRTNMRSPPSSQ